LSQPIAVSDPQPFRSTLVVVPRETFSQSCESLDDVLSSVPDGQPIVLVDGHSPLSVSEGLRTITRNRPVTFIRSNRYLSPNEARNLGVHHVKTEYVVFVDNDLFVEPGWLERLERCADETGAAAVGPLCCIGRPTGDVVHIAGGPNRIVPNGRGGRHHVEKHEHAGRKRAEISGELQRHRTELLEFHCLLVRKSVLDDLGPFDPELTALHEHNDLCLQIENAGGTLWLEPSAVVTYVPPHRLVRSDRAFWFLRWSRSWSLQSIEHFAAKWDLDPKDPARQEMIQYSRFHRRLGVPNFRPLPKGPSTKARLERAVFRTWALAFESASLLMTMRTRRLPLKVQPATTGSKPD
jgi:GT2 family glycosyltransferase